MPLPMIKISDGVPAYTNDSNFYPASNANNGVYADVYRSAAAPAGNADSGELCQFPTFTTPFPVYVALDLSGVANLGQVLVHWSQPLTGNYNPALIGQLASNVPTSYTIDANAAAGGSLPGSGWVTKVTVSNSAPYHSRQFLIDMTGYKWLRMNTTHVTGSGGGVNANVAFNLDVHSAPDGATDSWLFAGDSIIQFAALYNDGGGLSAVMAQQIANAFPVFFPVWEDGGVSGYTATDLEAVLPTWLALFPGQYVVLAVGTNDANQGGALLTNFSSKMTNMVQAILAAGKTPVIPHIPWGRTSTVQTNAPTLNGQIDTIIAANSGAIAGPDLWTAFLNNQSYIDAEIHPTNPDGYNFYRTQWINWATANIYRNILVTSAQSRFKVRAVQNTSARSTFKVRAVLRTQARSSFKIQLSNAGPKPYRVVGVGTILDVHPFTTITSEAIVVDQLNAPQNSLTATVTALFPDASTTSPQVYSVGSGQYTATYKTKGEGTITELWTFTDGQGSQVQYQHLVVCSY